MSTKRNKSCVTVGFVALGCPKNMVDSERILAQIARAGLVITQDADNADVVVINTCGFISPAKDEAMDAIRKAVSRKQKGCVRKVIVAGCLPQRLGKVMLEQTPGIDAIVGLEHRDNIVEVIEKILSDDSRVQLVTPGFTALPDDRVRLRIMPRHYSYLRISEGCSRKCAFCTIPAIRGKSRSKPKEIVIAEAKDLVGSGAVELNIIGQDITIYGQDLNSGENLPDLLIDLAKIPRLTWIRLLYLYPTGITDRLIDTVASCKKIVHYFDIPIQHINPHILKLMRRPHSKDRICRLIEKLRTRLPDCVIRTTLIVGFPGETDARFDELLDFVKRARFDHLGCFTFYPEQGTPAARFPHQIPRRIKKQRFDEIMRAQQRIVFEKNRSRIGETLTCLIDSVNEKRKTATTRYFGQAPQIDPVCIIKNHNTPFTAEHAETAEKKTKIISAWSPRPSAVSAVRSGNFIKAKIVGTRGYDLLCEQIS
jgi:ribosomal protein S12 methylthiotransferase